MTTLLESSGLDAGYSKVPVVRGVNLTIRAGEMVLLAGPNGAGKTTTCLALTGAISPLQGEVQFLGAPTTLPLHARVRAGLGVIPEGRAVFKSLTVRDNLRLGTGGIAKALEHFPELQKRLRVKAGVLSGGEQQMLVLARILAAEPKVIVADELSLGLAPIIVDRLLAALRDAADGGSGVLVVEQHVQIALQVCDRVYFLSRGRVAHEGRAAEVAENRDVLADLYL